MQASGRNQKNMKPEYRISSKEFRIMKLTLPVSSFGVRYSAVRF